MEENNIKVLIGIDNGSTGSIGSIFYKEAPNEKGYEIVDVTLIKTPIKKVRSYTKEEHYVSLLDLYKMSQYINIIKSNCCSCIIYTERPMINPIRFKSSVSACMNFASLLNIIEVCNIEKYYVIDSKKWQHTYFDNSIAGSKNLKDESKRLGLTLFSNYDKITKVIKSRDADALFISLYGLEEEIHKVRGDKNRIKKGRE